jgi:uncharacterized membrane protein
MFRSIRNAFFTGIIVLLPLGITLIVINFLLEKIGTPASKLFFWFLDPTWRSLPAIELLLNSISLLVVFSIITILGYSSRFFLGRWLFRCLEQLLNRVPLINTVYSTVKQIVDTFSQQKQSVFQEVVLIEYPRPGCYAIGFLTGDSKGEVQQATGNHIVNIFIPTTPNPTSGFLLMLPEPDIIRLKMSISDGMKLIISGGAVVPEQKSGKALNVKNPSIRPL